MNYKKNGSPAYLQLYRRLRSNIENGVYKYGERLPSKRNLCDETGVSVITAEHAYGILCDEGYAEARERSGYYVIYTAADCFPVANPARPSGELHRRQESKSEFSFPIFAKTARRVLTEYDCALFEKSPGNGILPLRRALSDYLARSRGIAAPPEQIVVGAGAEYLYSLIVQVLGRDRRYAIENPSYEKIRRVYEAEGARVEALPLAADGIESAALAKSSAKALHITPFNSFPSGITATASKRREYVEWANRRDAVIIEDDFDSEFSPLAKIEDTVFSLAPGRTIYLNTFSKTIAPSVRMGYMLLPEALMPEFERAAGFYACTVSAFEQYIVAELISGGDFERHINKIRRARRRSARL